MISTLNLGPGRGHNLSWNSDRVHNSRWNFDPSYIEPRIATQEGVKIQQRASAENSTAKEDNTSTKDPFNIDPGSVFNVGPNFIFQRLTLIYLYTLEFQKSWVLNFQSTMQKLANYT